MVHASANICSVAYVQITLQLASNPSHIMQELGSKGNPLQITSLPAEGDVLNSFKTYHAQAGCHRCQTEIELEKFFQPELFLFDTCILDGKELN